MTITDLELKARLSTIKEIELSPEIDGCNTEEIIVEHKGFAIGFDIEYYVDTVADGYEIQYDGDRQSEKSYKYRFQLRPFETVFLSVNWIEINNKEVTVTKDGEEMDEDELIDVVEGIFADKLTV